MRLNWRACARLALLLLVAAVITVTLGCGGTSQLPPLKTRAEAIPCDAVKVTPQSDLFPPVLHNDGWEDPVPMGGPINTAGGEDSPFITPDGGTFFFFFTPDVRVPANEQLTDGVTGIWWSRKVNDVWSEPERIVLNNDVSLEGCPCLHERTLWFCSVRAGNYGEVDIYTAEYRDGAWKNWRNAGEQLNREYSVGELHISADGRTMYFGWEAPGGFGGRDIWKSEKLNGEWGDPVNLGPSVNSAGNEDRPFLSSDGKELWFDGHSRLGYPGPAVFRSVKQSDGTWGEAEEIVSSFAAEPTLDDAGNLYFVHHFLDGEGNMIEADIYVAYRK